MGLGETLKSARIQSGITLEHIEEETKIRRLYLEAIENENYGILPPRVYAVGFVKRYARFLGLDENELVEEFKQAAYGGQHHDEEIVQVAKKDFNIPVKNILAGLLFLLIALWVGNYMVGFFSRAVEDNRVADPGSGIEIQEPKDNNDPTEGEENPGTVENEPETAVVSVKARSDCWLQAIVDGEKVFEAVLPAGQEKNLEGRQSVYIRVGNAGGVDIIYNGEQIDPLGRTGEVKDKEFIVNDKTG
ncbi:transcriptional regulator [hydrocarbon metagenome]|uniref:Transcriptional regulator n=1 Tax=hydrocarbon metagenome TaxID=938273 RepID=A0A0W8E618_9ZZZZ